MAEVKIIFNSLDCGTLDLTGRVTKPYSKGTSAKFLGNLQMNLVNVYSNKFHEYAGSSKSI